MPPLPPGASAGGIRYADSPTRSPPRSRDQSPGRRDPFMASHEDVSGTGNYAMSSLNPPGVAGPGSFTTGSNYGTAPSSPYQAAGGSFAGGSYNQGAYNQGSQGYAQPSFNRHAGASSTTLNDFGAVEHGRYPHSEDEEHRPLTEGAAFSGGFYPPTGPGG
jgi:hypothetical protein